MKEFYTPDLTTERIKSLTRDEQYYIYNGLDSALTLEIHPHLVECHNEQTEKVYAFERALQSPALCMMRRGILVDPQVRAQMIIEDKARLNILESRLSQLTNTIWGKGINPNSPSQLMELLYEHMKFPKEYTVDKGERRVSTNRECLERIRDKHRWGKPVVNFILAIRDVEKRLSVLNNSVDRTGRFHSSYNIGGTETGRWSSSKNVRGTGSNAQNITHDLRNLFIPDPGYKLCYADLEQAESYGVGHEAEDLAYIDACKSGDLHTSVAKMVWPELPWTGVVEEDRAVADRPFYRHESYRDIAKKVGHASNYYGTAWTISRRMKIPLDVVEKFQEDYFNAFPGIRRWHSEVQQTLQGTACLITPFGRRRHFFGRLRDDSTLREAINFVPQSIVADILNSGLLSVWRELDGDRLQILGQIHDAVLFQYKVDQPEMVQRAVELMSVPVEIHGRTMVIPVEAEVGYNWHDLAKLGSEKEAEQTPPNYAEADFLNLKAG